MNLVVIAAGRDTGLVPGCELTLYREDKCLDKLIVEKVDAKWSYARRLLEFEMEPPRVGDGASTKIY